MARRILLATGALLALVACAGGSGTGAADQSTLAPVAGPTADQLRDIKVRLQPVVQASEPIWLGIRPADDTIYVAGKEGFVWPVTDGLLDGTPLLDMSSLTASAGEQGLLGVAFHPSEPLLYVSYTDRQGDSHVDEYRLDGDRRLSVDERRSVLTLDQPYANHNGGQIFFGPDGLLYVAFGDGGSANDPERHALDLGTWLGKILRIDPRPTAGAPYAVPPDNPFVGRSGAKPEIYSYGLRNPWRSAFDFTTGDLWVADVGQNKIEEVNRRAVEEGAGRGTNFGWSAFEGRRRFNDDQPTGGAVPPVFQYDHGDGCSITGGVVYRGKAIAGLQGAYLFGDYCRDDVRALTLQGKAQAVRLAAGVSDVVGFGEDADGEVYVLSLAGQVFKLVPA
ncbi:MAG TPA: PQQ-dependent sugar dehydrogenase [Acidimicrobiales bacterium]